MVTDLFKWVDKETKAELIKEGKIEGIKEGIKKGELNVVSKMLIIDAQQELIDGNQEEKEVFQKDKLIANINKVIEQALIQNAHIIFVRDKDVGYAVIVFPCYMTDMKHRFFLRKHRQGTFKYITHSLAGISVPERIIRNDHDFIRITA